MTSIFVPPFSFEKIVEQPKKDIRFRIRDSRDDAVCSTYVEENARLVVNALNALHGVK